MKVNVIVDKKKKSRKSIKVIEIQANSDSKPGSFKFISFLLLIDKFSHFKWFTTKLLMKMDIVIDEKKKLQILSTYWEQTSVTATAIANPGYLNLSAFHYL